MLAYHCVISDSCKLRETTSSQTEEDNTIVTPNHDSTDSESSPPTQSSSRFKSTHSLSSPPTQKNSRFKSTHNLSLSLYPNNITQAISTLTSLPSQTNMSITNSPSTLPPIPNSTCDDTTNHSLTVLQLSTPLLTSQTYTTSSTSNPSSYSDLLPFPSYFPPLNTDTPTVNNNTQLTVTITNLRNTTSTYFSQFSSQCEDLCIEVEYIYEI